MLDDAPAASAPGGPLFAGLTGRRVNIGIIDSGVHPGHPHIGRMAGGVAITARGGVEEGETAYLDRLGHGTAVTAAIQEKAPEANCYAVRVFDNTLRTTATALLAALDWCVCNGMDVVNLSLGSANSRHELAFAEAALRAEAAGVLLVAARSADGAACYPGRLPTVLGVELDWDCARDSYRRERLAGQDILHASGFPRPIPGVEPRRNLYGVSFAVANMTGFAARAREAIGPGHGDGQARLVRRLLEGEPLQRSEGLPGQ